MGARTGSRPREFTLEKRRIKYHTDTCCISGVRRSVKAGRGGEGDVTGQFKPKGGLYAPQWLGCAHRFRADAELQGLRPSALPVCLPGPTLILPAGMASHAGPWLRRSRHLLGHLSPEVPGKDSRWHPGPGLLGGGAEAVSRGADGRVPPSLQSAGSLPRRSLDE